MHNTANKEQTYYAKYQKKTALAKFLLKVLIMNFSILLKSKKHLFNNVANRLFWLYALQGSDIKTKNLSKVRAVKKRMDSKHMVRWRGYFHTDK